VPYSIFEVVKDTRACWPAVKGECTMLRKGEVVVFGEGYNITEWPDGHRSGLYCLRSPSMKHCGFADLMAIEVNGKRGPVLGISSREEEEKKIANLQKDQKDTTDLAERKSLDGLTGFIAYLETCDQWDKVSPKVGDNIERMLNALPFTMTERRSSLREQIEKVKGIGVGKFSSLMAPNFKKLFWTMENIDWSR
jgi:hypothetical protein